MGTEARIGDIQSIAVAGEVLKQDFISICKGTTARNFNKHIIKDYINLL